MQVSNQQLQKTLTISIAAYNSEKYLAKCLDSLTDCRRIDKLEIIVINDGSTDSTRKIAEHYQRKYPESISLINKENGGHGSTLNRGIKLATGKYFRFVDADDWVDASGIDRVVEYLEQTTVDLVLNPYTCVNMDGTTVRERLCTKPMSGIEYGKEYELDAVQNAINYETHMIIFRTNILKQLGKPILEHCYYVDVEYMLYPIPYVQTVVFLDYVLYRYLYGTPEQSVNAPNMIRRRDEHLRVTKNVSRFFCSCKEKKIVNGIELIHNRVLGMIRSQYDLYFKMRNTKKGKEEAIQFDRWLKEKCGDLYDDVTAQSCPRTMVLLRMLRRTNFCGYRMSLTLLHALGQIT